MADFKEIQVDGQVYQVKDETARNSQGGYEPPTGGIPKTDLASDVQTSLGKADTALQQADKTQLQSAINSLQSALDTLIGSGNVQGAIDTFNEVKAFLYGINTSDPTLANQLLALNNAISAVQTSLATKANSADVYSKSEVDGKVAEAGSGAVSVTTNQDGTFVIHVGETDYTINLNHTHESMAKLVVDTAANLPDASEMENDTIYGELDDGEIATIYLGGYPFYGGGGASSGPVLRRPADGATIDMGQTTSGTVSKTINVKGKSLTQALIIQLTGTGYSFGTTQPSGITRDSATQLTIPASSISAVNSLNGVDIVVVYTGSDTDEDASGTLGINSSSPDNIDREVTLVANKVTYEDLVGVKLTGTQWLQTDFVPTPNTDVEMKLKFTETSRSWDSTEKGYYFLTCYTLQSSQKQYAMYLIETTNNQATLSSIVTNSSPIAVNLPRTSVVLDNSKFSYSHDGLMTFVAGENGTVYSVQGNPVSQQTDPLTIGLYHSTSETDTLFTKFILTIYELKITDNGTVVRDYKPARKNGIPGLYDELTDHFISSKTSYPVEEVISGS